MPGFLDPTKHYRAGTASVSIKSNHGNICKMS